MPACTLTSFKKFISTVILDLKALNLLLEQIGKRTFSLGNEELTRVKNLHGIPWNSMDSHGKFSMEFHGGLGHQFPWNSMEISP